MGGDRLSFDSCLRPAAASQLQEKSASSKPEEQLKKNFFRANCSLLPHAESQLRTAAA